MRGNFIFHKEWLFCVAVLVCGYHFLPWRAWKGSDAEKINLVVKEFIRDPVLQQRLMRSSLLRHLRDRIDMHLFSEDLFYDYKSHADFAKNVEFVPYKTAAEFWEINPDCCVVKLAPNNESCDTVIPANPYPDKSVNKSCVYVYYLIRYKDDNGNIKLRKSYDRRSGFIRTAALIDDEGRVLEWTTEFLMG